MEIDCFFNRIKKKLIKPQDDDGVFFSSVSETIGGSARKARRRYQATAASGCIKPISLSKFLTTVLPGSIVQSVPLPWVPTVFLFMLGPNHKNWHITWELCRNLCWQTNTASTSSSSSLSSSSPSSSSPPSPSSPSSPPSSKWRYTQYALVNCYIAIENGPLIVD